MIPEEIFTIILEYLDPDSRDYIIHVCRDFPYIGEYIKCFSSAWAPFIKNYIYRPYSKVPDRVLDSLIIYRQIPNSIVYTKELALYDLTEISTDSIDPMVTSLSIVSTSKGFKTLDFSKLVNLKKLSLNLRELKDSLILPEGIEKLKIDITFGTLGIKIPKSVLHLNLMSSGNNFISGDYPNIIRLNTNLVVSESKFPNLKHLTLTGTREKKILHEAIQGMPNLKKLTIKSSDIEIDEFLLPVFDKLKIVNYVGKSLNNICMPKQKNVIVKNAEVESILEFPEKLNITQFEKIEFNINETIGKQIIIKTNTQNYRRL